MQEPGPDMDVFGFFDPPRGILVSQAHFDLPSVWFAWPRNSAIVREN